MIADGEFDALLDTHYALIRAMEEESELLALSGPAAAGIEELARVKIRLASRLEEIDARLDQGDSGWVRRLDEDSRAKLADAGEELRKAAAVNGEILERQIMLSAEPLLWLAGGMSTVASLHGSFEITGQLLWRPSQRS